MGEQTEEEKAVKRENAVRNRCQDYNERFDRMRESDLMDKAKELHERWQALEGEDYDTRELLVRINEIARRRRKTIHLGGSRRMQQDENEKTFLGVKGMADKYMNIVDEKNKQKPSKKIDLPKKQVSESEDFEEPEPEPEGDAEPAEVEVDDE